MKIFKYILGKLSRRKKTDVQPDIRVVGRGTLVLHNASEYLASAENQKRRAEAISVLRTK